MFLTFYVYGADGSPYWVTGTLQAVGPPNGFPFAFTGVLYESHGPYFGDGFDPSVVTRWPVGTVTFTATRGNAAMLQYSVDGVNVSKSLERETLRYIDFSGIYNGVIDYLQSNCPASYQNGQEVHAAGAMTIAQSETTYRLLFQSTTFNCTFLGTYSQTGSIGAASGNLACTNGTSGSFTIDIMQWTVLGMTARISAQTNACDFQGIIGGIGAH